MVRTKKLLVLGDSFCHGIGTIKTFKCEENTQKAFGYYLSQHLNLDYVNLAEPGSNILRAISVGYEYILKNKDDIGKVIIGWTNRARVGFYSDETAFQILPEFCWLGNLLDDDIFVKYNRGIKFVTDKNNEIHLKKLKHIYDIFLHNNIFDAVAKEADTSAILFKTWLDAQHVDYLDFNCFTAATFDVKCPHTFLDVWKIKNNEHPTIAQHEKMAELLKGYI